MTDREKAINDTAEIMMRVFEEQTNALLYNLRPDIIEQKKRLEKQQANCPHIEWEQDMGFKVPYCGKTGQYCNVQCFWIQDSKTDSCDGWLCDDGERRNGG